MGMDDAVDFWLDRRRGNVMNCQTSRKYMHSQLEQVGDTAMSSMAASMEVVPSSMANPCSSANNIADHLLVSDWNPFVSVPEHADFIGSAASSHTVDTQRNQRVSSSGICLVDQIQTRLRFGCENISEIVNSCALSEDLQIIRGALGPTDLPVSSDEHHAVGKDSKEKKRKTQELGASDSQSKFHRTQSVEVEHKKDVILPGSAKGAKEKDGNETKGEQNTGSKTHKSASSKQAKESSSNADAPKEDYIHVRAKRGQATNSHSLAERLRREKISERMRFLQDLVPGCSKITGKAVMLDEIINYVQSLQRQVEFLSMKLATVSPELNYDIEQILSKDILLSQSGGSAAVLRFAPGLTNCYQQFQPPIEQGPTQVELDGNPHSAEVLKHNLPPILPAAQIPNVWDDNLQGVMQQMGFIPGAQLDAAAQQPGKT